MTKLNSPLFTQRGGAFLSMESVLKLWNNYIGANLNEQMRLLPTSIFTGVALLALLTQSFSSSILLLSMLETSFISMGIRKLATFVDITHTVSSSSQCVEGPFTLESLLEINKVKSSFPSSPIFFLATACSYVISSMFSQKDEMEALGDGGRYYMAIFTSFLFLFAISSYRLMSGCEGAGIVVLSLIFGCLLGGLLVLQNNRLFGRDSTNLNGIPLLRERTKDGKPIYVCPK